MPTFHRPLPEDEKKPLKPIRFGLSFKIRQTEFFLGFEAKEKGEEEFEMEAINKEL